MTVKNIMINGVAVLGLALSSVFVHAANYEFRMPIGTSLEAPAQNTVSLGLAYAALPEASQDTPYSYNFNDLLTISGEVSPPLPADINWSVTGGLPDGLSLSGSTLEGTPTVSGTRDFTLTASVNGSEGAQSYSIIVNGMYLEGVSQVKSGYSHTCALMENKTIKCWGSNSLGQLGDGTNNASSNPVLVSGITDATSLEVGYNTSCAKLGSGEFKCWGQNDNGQLGDGSNSATTVPVTLAVLTGATKVSLGYFHSCAIGSDSALSCWGGNQYGQLGDGTVTSRQSAATVYGLGPGSVRETYSDYSHSCAILTDGTVRCWGNNNKGKLGTGNTTVNYTPGYVLGLYNVTELAIASENGCALMAGAVKCWGANQDGQLGDGSATERHSAIDVPGLSGVTQIDIGWGHSCAKLSDNTLSCWGFNGEGQLGNGSTNNRVVATPVPNVNNVKSLSAGFKHTCASLNDGTVECWGKNGDGQLGDGTPTNRLSAIQVKN